MHHRPRFMSRWIYTVLAIIGLTVCARGHGEPASPVKIFSFASNNCIDCHGSPPNIAATSGEGSSVLGLLNADGIDGRGINEQTWLQKPSESNTTLKDRINGVRPAMTTVANDADKLAGLYNYLVALRDGAHNIPAGGTLSFGTKATGTTTDSSTSFSLFNYRNTDLNYTIKLDTQSSKLSLITPAVTGTGCMANLSAGKITGTIPAVPIPGPPPAEDTNLYRSCTITVPVQYRTGGLASNDTGTLVIDTSDNTPAPVVSPNTIAVSGSAYVPTPVFSVTPETPLDKFTARVNKDFDTRSVKIENKASTPTGTLVLSSVELQGDGFSLNGGTCSNSISLDPGKSCTVGVKFSPTRSGISSAASLSYSGSLTFKHNAAVSPSTVNLAGTGTQSIASISNLLSFGEVKKDNTETKNLTITNNGKAELNLSGVQLQGSAAADYTVIPNGCTAPLAEGASCAISLRFSPTTNDGSTRPATLTLQTDAANLTGGTATVALTGIGTAQSAPMLSAPALAFADTVLGETSAPMTVTITNPRTGTLTYALSLPAEFSEDTPACAGRIVAANGGTCTISLRFRPQAGAAAGSRAASVPVTFTVPAGQTAPAALSLAVSGTALWPVSASPTTLAPSATLGATTLVTSAVLNRSSGAVTLGSVTFGGSAAGDYSIDASSVCRTGLSLPAGQGCTLVLRYAPTQLGTRSATLAIAHNAVAGSPLALTLTGTVDIGQLSLSAGSASFTDTALGSSSPASSLTLRNTGSAPLTLSSLTLGGSHPGDFSRGGTCTVGGALAVGAECTVTLQFQPTALGARSAQLAIAHTGAAPSPVVLSLTGQGIPQPLGVLAIDGSNPLDVGSQTVNGLYAARTVRLRNTGTAALQLTGVTLSGSGFSLDATPACASGTTLAIGQTCDLMLRFAPVAVDTDYRATLTVTHSASGTPQVLALIGRGTAAVVPVVTWVGSTDPHDFGTQAIGGTATPTHTVSLRNQGPGAIRLTLVHTVGLDAAMFPVQGGAADACVAGVLLDQDRTCSVTLAFSPGTPGTHRARLQVVSSGTALAPLELTGTGLGPVGGSTLAVTPTRLDFEATRVGAVSPPMAVTLRGEASSAVRVLGWAVEGAFSVDSGTCPAPPFLLAAGDTCTVAVRFRPTAEGTTGGVLQITSSPGTDLPATTLQVPLSGPGQAAADVVGSGGGGCSIARAPRADRLDPTLIVLAALALLILGLRRHRARRPPSRHDR